MKMLEKLFARNRVYTGNAVHFSVDEIILPDGKKATREYMEHPGAVAVIPFVDDKNIILVRQYRYPVHEITWELPAGKLDKGEKIAVCVKRELEEETGYTASRIRKLISFWPTTAFSNEVIHIFSAHGLKERQKCPDEDEFIDHKIVPLAKALAWVKTGRIRDSKSIIGLLYCARYSL
ncbi:MAG: NUDIX hydrolase [Endomicrobiales bacterium]|jgi:ADP-ribose pyrophosphatase